MRREPGIDGRPAKGVIPDGALDPDVLRLAFADGRVLVSSDLRTMPTNFSAFIASHHSLGVLLIPQATPIGAAIERLLQTWLLWSAEDLEGQIWWLPQAGH